MKNTMKQLHSIKWRSGLFVLAATLFVVPLAAYAGGDGAIGDPPLDAEEDFVDTVLPAHETIAPADFAGVFSRIQLSPIAVEGEGRQRTERLQAAAGGT